MEQLIIYDHQKNKTKVPLDQETTQIGRSSETDIVLADPKLSRHHCEIRFEEDQFVLSDLDSKNGTYVNGERVDRRQLTSGDRIQIGAVVIYLGEEPEQQPAEEKEQETVVQKSEEDRKEQLQFKTFYTIQDSGSSLTRILVPIAVYLLALTPLFLSFSSSLMPPGRKDANLARFFEGDDDLFQFLREQEASASTNKSETGDKGGKRNSSGTESGDERGGNEQRSGNNERSTEERNRVERSDLEGTEPSEPEFSRDLLFELIHDLREQGGSSEAEQFRNDLENTDQ